MRGPGLRLVAALGLLALPGCGPTPEEAGGAVLLVTPGVILAGGVPLWILFLLWRTGEPEIRFRWRPTLIAAGVAALGSGLVLVMARDLDGTLEWIGVAVLAFGTSYAAVLLFAWRIGMLCRNRGRMPDAFTWAHLVPITLLVLPALAMLLGADVEDDTIALIWVWPGYMGWVPGSLYALFLIEGAVRRLRSGPAPVKKRTNSAPRP
jgi:hypothetical protein